MGYFITFEGADGCGKTTQMNLIADFLNKKKVDNIITREPGGSNLGLKLREILLYYEGEVANMCEMFLYLADRAQHIKTKIEPAVKEGKIVLCDRHTDSTLAYQGYGRGMDIEKIKYLNEIATENFKPDLTLVFDVESEEAQRRVGKEKDRLESEGMNFHKKVREGYLDIAKKEPSRVKVINANRSIEEVFEETKRIISEFLNI